MKKIQVESRYILVGKPGVCAYCGDAADTIDHTLPRSHVAEHRQAYAKYKIAKVHSCSHCNSVLGDRIFSNFAARKLFINQRLRGKFYKELRYLAWTDEEINKLGRGLRDQIIARRSVAKWIDRRVIFSGVPVTEGVPDRVYWSSFSDPFHPS